MKFRRYIFSLLCLAWLIVAAWTWQHAQAQQNGQTTTGAPTGSAPTGKDILLLNVKGQRERGAVAFDHALHQGLINPDPAWPYRAQAAAACVGCHHSSDEYGLPQLWKCTVCHQSAGKGTGDYVNTRCGQGCEPTGNPKNCACDELYFERAFHESCIGCHRATNAQKQNSLAPVSCSGCHATFTK